MPEPRVLAAFLQTHLACLEEDAVVVRALQANLAPDVLKTIREAGRLSTLELGLHADLNNRVFEAVGPERAGELARQAVLASFAQPFLEPLIRGALVILGNRVSRHTRWAPKAWGVLFRDMGQLDWREIEPGRAELVLRDAPALLLDDAEYAEALAAGFSALFEISGTQGSVGWSVIAEGLRFELAESGPAGAA